ncbi:MAG: OmpA family protein [Haliscomenobacter sp.]|nr:OmpA family protein [Haliscomenobacter sp.]
MRHISFLSKELSAVWRPYNRMLKSVVIGALILAGIQASLQAQEYKYTKPTFWVGAAAGANFNFYRGSTQRLNSTFSSPVAFHNGNNVGLYLAPLLEYQSRSGVGVMLQAGYDSRKSTFEQQLTPCNCPADLSTNLSYITVEPSLRVAPFGSGFYLYGGPRFAFNLDKAFTYKLGINPAFPDQLPTPDVTGDLSDVKKTLSSMQVGAGYDIPLSSQDQQIQAMFSPFISFQPYFGQSPRSIETWNITTLRVGAALKFGSGRENPIPTPPATGIEVLPPFNDVRFSVISPPNIPTERRVRETFPLRNYVFFDSGSTAIPDRYVLLTKNQITGFKEDQLEEFAPKRLSGRSAREMTAYYNILNILGDRLGKNPASAITLVGSSEKGPEAGRAMAESIKQYLTDVWSINNSRIGVEGRNKPLNPFLKPGGTQDIELLLEGDRRVSIETTSPELLMEFQTGADAGLKPVEIIAMQEAPLDSYVTFKVDGERKAFSPWRLEIKDESGKMQTFGPFTQGQIKLPGKSIMGTRPKGRYNVTMTGVTSNGSAVRKQAVVDMVQWTPPQNEEGLRFSIIYDFDESKAVNMYEKYLTTVIVPKIPTGATVIIQGHTDIVGDEAYNQRLSLSRANDVRTILEAGLRTAGRSDVKFEVHDMGEDTNTSPFENALPEERAYNRTVIIDIIPRK